MTETLTPEGASFQAWMARELRGIEAALGGQRWLRRSPAPPSPRPPSGCGAPAPRRDGTSIWSGVDLEIGRGEFVAVLGPNGAGKSTLLDVLLGLLPLSAGSVEVLGAAPGPATARRIGYLPQRRSFDAGTRVRGRDLVRLGLDGGRWGLPLPGGSAPAAARRRGGSRR